MVAEPVPSLSFEEYLRFDEVSDRRHEWVAGQVFVMAGGTSRHLATIQALFFRLAPLARASGCRPWITDRRLRTSEASYYPDAFVVCGPEAHPHYETDATWIVEVLSESTASVDLREKAAAYATLPGLGTYVVVDPEIPMVRVGTPGPRGWSWSHHRANAPLAVPGGAVDLAEVWAEVDGVAPL